MIDTGHAVTGHITALGHEPFHYTIFYVQVDDVQAYLDKAASFGGKTLVPPVSIPPARLPGCRIPKETRLGSGSPLRNKRAT